MNNFFSIIICCYNSDKYLEDTINSILNQNFTNWELIFIDDGSSDSTKNIIKKYVNNSKNLVRYFYQSNKGYAFARNKGVELANGKWIALLDHDDLMHKDRLSQQYDDIINNNDCKLFTGNSVHVNSEGVFVRECYSVFDPRHFVTNQTNFGYELLINGCFIGTETVTFEKKMLQTIGNFNTNYKLLSDYDFFIRVGLKFPIYVNKNVLAKFRIHDSSSQYHLFKSGKGYWEYVNLYFIYFFAKNLILTQRLQILKRMFLYIFYGFARKLTNVKYIKGMYTIFKKLK